MFDRKKVPPTIKDINSINVNKSFFSLSIFQKSYFDLFTSKRNNLDKKILMQNKVPKK